MLTHNILFNLRRKDMNILLAYALLHIIAIICYSQKQYIDIVDYVVSIYTIVLLVIQTPKLVNKEIQFKLSFSTFYLISLLISLQSNNRIIIIPFLVLAVLMNIVENNITGDNNEKEVSE